METPDGPLRLLFFFDDPYTDADLAAVRALVEALRGADIDWPVAPPLFVDHLDDDVDAGEPPIRTVGLVLALRRGADGTMAVDRAQFDAVTAVVDRVAELTGRIDPAVGMELDQLSIGWLEGGAPTANYVRGFLEPWREALAQEENAP